MGMRNRNCRKNRRRQRRRAQARRHSALALARPRCADCNAFLVEDAFESDVWHCAPCDKTYLKQGPDLLPQHDEIFFLVEEALRRAA